MNLTTFNRVLLPVLEAGIVPWCWGYHAKGKSESIETFYRSRDWLVFNFRLNCMADVGDFLGLQDFITNPITGEKTATKFCMPDWLKQSIEFCTKNPDKRACVFIDEINRASRFDLLGPVFQMSLDKRLHTTAFPPNLDVICAGNPNTKNYKVLTVSDEALLSRFWHVYFSPSRKEWFDYTAANEYVPSIEGFIRENDTFLEQDDLEVFNTDQFAKPDRRKWAMINKLIKMNKLDKEDYKDVFAGLIGMTATIAFEGYLAKLDKPVTVEEILSSYPKVRERVLAAKNSERARTDIIGVATNKVIDYFKDDPAINDTEGENVISFIKDLPNEHMFQILHAIYKKRKFHDFCEAKYEDLKMIELEQRLEVIRRTVLPETLQKNV